MTTEVRVTQHAARWRGRTAWLTALLLVATGCASTVTGYPEPESAPLPVAEPSAAPAAQTPSALLLPPERFPEPYAAVALPAQAVAQAAPDLTGIQPGSRVEPGGCLPPDQDFGPAGTAMAVGTDNASRATITVEVTVSAANLSDYRTYVTDCGRVEATRRGVTATVSTELRPDPAPPVPGVATLALTRTVRSGRQTGEVTQSMTTRIGQSDDVRVTVTYMSFDSAEPDTASLDRVFRDAVVYATGG